MAVKGVFRKAERKKICDKNMGKKTDPLGGIKPRPHRLLICRSLQMLANLDYMLWKCYWYLAELSVEQQIFTIK